MKKSISEEEDTSLASIPGGQSTAVRAATRRVTLTTHANQMLKQSYPAGGSGSGRERISSPAKRLLTTMARNILRTSSSRWAAGARSVVPNRSDHRRNCGEAKSHLGVNAEAFESRLEAALVPPGSPHTAASKRASCSAGIAVCRAHFALG